MDEDMSPRSISRHCNGWGWRTGARRLELCSEMRKGTNRCVDGGFFRRDG